MSWLVPLAIVLITVVVMEMTAYAVHRWIMHGPLGWGWHKSHHDEHGDHQGGFEKNDLYGLIFAAIAAALFIFASGWLWWVAVGMSVYGVIYLLMHDCLVHQRWPFRAIPRKGYLRRVYQAHKMHHAVEGRDGCVSFGFVYAPPLDRLKKELRKGGALRRDTGIDLEQDR
ncbi:MAG: sterol desaturase family protein [Paracoccus sp. (in: a-proteobacteria)]|nr:sterol desaturase family protein [Paracoccus sp. (in: a-proteobacteria)]